MTVTFFETDIVTFSSVKVRSTSSTTADCTVKCLLKQRDKSSVITTISADTTLMLDHSANAWLCSVAAFFILFISTISVQQHDWGVVTVSNWHFLNISGLVRDTELVRRAQISNHLSNSIHESKKLKFKVSSRDNADVTIWGYFLKLTKAPSEPQKT